MKEIEEYYKDFNDKEMKEINILYFNSLHQKFSNKDSVELTMFDGKNDSSVVPLPIATEADKENILVQDYEELSNEISPKLKNYGLCICKMQAGLGTSVKRDDLVQKYAKRSKLGSKGTDLFIKYKDKMISIAEVQLLKAEEIKNQDVFKYVAFLNLLNSETEDAVLDVWNNTHIEKNIKYGEVFSTENLKRYPEIYQLMMPTISEDNSITFDRVAPAGHAFLGFYEILKIYRDQTVNDEILVIGNGEDLKSTPDAKILSWIAENDIPISMITTTKLEKDKKGGQLAIVKEATPYVAIVEKAQAEKTEQLSYFEELGLRSTDERSLFNTNIVVINKKALKSMFDKYLDISEEKFREILSPDLIKNTKQQDGKNFVQLEGAIGSTLLNLDKYFRQNFKVNLISFLNLAPENRERFFVPIKKREDFDGIYGK